MLQEFLTEQEVADTLHVSPRTLRQWRVEGRGPRWIQLEGKAIRYPEADLATYLAASPTGGRVAL